MLLISFSASAQSSAASLNPLLPPSQSIPPPVDKWMPLIMHASSRFGIPVAWIRAVMRVESDGQAMQDGVPITSPAGAMGLMQVMPGTYAEMRTRYDLGDDPYDPQDNIAAGTAFLREMYLRYGYPDLFAAYNAGPARFDDYLYGEAALPPETMAYLKALGQFQFANTQAAYFSTGRGDDSAYRSIDVIVGRVSSLTQAAPGVAGFAPSSEGLFMALQTQISVPP
jgi:soluble lytic murein transglycosylase-like protein